jgi:hypothetical protein
MKGKVRSAAHGTLFLMLWAAVVAVAGSGGPRLMVPETRFDFGKVTDGHAAEHVFELRNTGDSVLEILNIQPT